MPTTYAHDLFGRLVCRELPGDLQNLIRQHQMMYRIGLQGPDILFYYHFYKKNGINQLGTLLHEQKATPFFERCRALADGDPETAAYVLGFLCHYMLDSTCHPYIAEYMAKSGAAHDELETEFDRLLMEKTGRNPCSFHPAASLRLSGAQAEKIAEVIGASISEEEIRSSVGSLRFLTGLVVCKSRGKYRVFDAIMGAAGISSFRGHLMGPDKSRRCEEGVQGLYALMKTAVPETAALAEEYLSEISCENKPLNPRFDRNYE